MIDGIRKFYIKYRGDLPAEDNHYIAERGFHELGVETRMLEKPIKDEEGNTSLVEPNWPSDIGPHVGVAGYIQDVKNALHIARKPQPPSIDYPEELLPWLGRKIERTTLGKVRCTLEPLFIKSVAHKILPGYVHKGDGPSRMPLVKYSDDLEVWTSEIVNFAAEYRVFVLRGEILDVRRYTGNWSITPSKMDVEAAVRAWRNAPVACCLDFGVVIKGGYHHTLLVEANDGFAFGTYGLNRKNYARMLAARWSELMSQPDLPPEDPSRPWQMTVTGHEVI